MRQTAARLPPTLPTGPQPRLRQSSPTATTPRATHSLRCKHGVTLLELWEDVSWRREAAVTARATSVCKAATASPAPAHRPETKEPRPSSLHPPPEHPQEEALAAGAATLRWAGCLGAWPATAPRQAAPHGAQSRGLQHKARPCSPIAKPHTPSLGLRLAPGPRSCQPHFLVLFKLGCPSFC